MKRKKKRQAFILKSKNCKIECGLADIYTNIPRHRDPRVHAHGSRRHNFFFHARSFLNFEGGGNNLRKCFRFVSVDSKKKKKFCS